MYDYDSENTPGEHFSEGMRSLTVRPGVTNIGCYAFRWRPELKVLMLPETVTSIDEGALSLAGSTLTCGIFFGGSEEQWDKVKMQYKYSKEQYRFFYNVVEWGYCGSEGDGTDLVWSIDKAGALTVCGEGAMADYSGSEDAPWMKYFASPNAAITVTLEEGVTRVGANAFTAAEGLKELIVLNRDCDLSALDIHEPAFLRGYLGSTAEDYANEHADTCLFMPLCDADWHHEVVWDEGTDSTCFEAGYREGVFCVDCGRYLYGHWPKPLAEHTWSGWTITRLPTVEEAGARTRVCTVCGTEETRSIEKLQPGENGGNDGSGDNGGGKDGEGFLNLIQKAMASIVKWFKTLLRFFGKY